MNEVFSRRRVPISALTAIAMLAAPWLCPGQATISVVAGTGNPPITPGAIGDGGLAKNAFLDGPDSVALDLGGNLYIREKARVRKVTPAGIISTVAGNGTNGYSGDNGPAASAQLGLGPQRAGLATDTAGNLYIADSNNYRVRKVDTSGKITTVAGNGKIGLGNSGNGGAAINTALCFPAGIAVDLANNLYIGSSICGGVRKVDPSGVITTVATKSSGPSYGVAVDDNGNLYLNAGGVPSQIRKVSAADGTVTVIAGNGTGGYSGDGGPATSAQLFEVDGVAVDKAGNVFITDSGNGRIRKVDTAGTITTIAGHGTVGPGAGCQNLFTTGCPATNLKFSPSDVALNSSGNLYTAGFVNGLVYKVSGVGGSGPPPPPVTGSTRTISHIANGAGWRTTIILINTGTQAESFELKFLDSTGHPLALDIGAFGITADLIATIQPGAAVFIRTAGTGATLQEGWAELTAPGDIDGNSIFGLQTPGQGDSEAAVPLNPSGGTELYIPFDSIGNTTGIAFSDPGQTAATASASILDEGGSAIPAFNTIQVPARGHTSFVLGGPFPGTQLKRGVVHFTSNTSIFGLGIRANGKAFTSIDALSGVTVAAKTIPHIANGAGWKTTFLLVCTGAQASQFTLNFWGDNGAALPLPLGVDGMVSTLTGTIPPGGLRVIQTTGAGDLVSGWAELTNLTGAIGGTAIFALESPGQSDSEAAVPFNATASTRSFMPYDYSPGYSTAVAFTNTTSGQIVVRASFTDDGGHNLGSGQIIVPAHGHAAAVLGSVLPAIAGTRGTVLLSADTPFLALGIRANGLAFTSLKVITK